MTAAVMLMESTVVLKCTSFRLFWLGYFMF